ncbi:MAG: twin-arginine translocase subunit TatC [Acidobacteria bacterium]|nr:MAG: twin-arginine translocase subunit TatC [Acidobacteriota bacterium]
MALVPFPGPQSRAFDSPLEEDDDASSSKMSFLEHLDELRKRIINSCIAIAVCVLLGFGFIDRIFNFIFAPTRRALPPGVKLIYTQPGEAFSLYIEIALIIGVMLAAPFIMYQVWRFIAPGLYSNEKRFAIPFVLFTTLGFLAGAAFNHYISFPFMMAFFASFNTPELAFMPKLEDVFGLYSKMLIGMGIVFQMPTVVFFLAKMKLLTARFLVANLKYALLLTFIIAAVITPTGDMMTQTIFAAPMIALYLLSIVIAWIVGPKRQKDT